MSSAANLASLGSDSKEDKSYFDENFSSEHLELGADPSTFQGDLRLRQASYFIAAQQLVVPPSPPPAAPTLQAASPLPPATIETIPKDEEHLYGTTSEEDRRRYDQLLEDSILARTLEQTHLSSHEQQLAEGVHLQSVLEQQLAEGAEGGEVEQGAEVEAEQSSQVQIDIPLSSSEQVTPSVRPRLILTSEQQQVRAEAS